MAIRTLITLLVLGVILSCAADDAAEDETADHPLEEASEPEATPAPAASSAPASADGPSLEEVANSYDDIFAEIDAEREAEEAAFEAGQQERRAAEEAARQEEVANRRRREEEARQQAAEASARERARQQEEAAELAARKEALAANPGVQELQASIEGATQDAVEALVPVRQWVRKEYDAMLAEGQKQPTIEIADAVLRLEGIAENLDPSGVNAEAMRKYMWIGVGTSRNLRTWGRLERPLDLQSVQQVIAATPLHPWGVLMDVELPATRSVNLDDRSAPSSPRAEFFPNRPRPIYEALGSAEGWARRMVRIADCEAGNSGVCELLRSITLNHITVRFPSLEALAEPYGGLDNITVERVNAATEAMATMDRIWASWEAANDTATELVERITALEILSRR